MTKATGRGRGWRRKAWDELAPSTKARYRRAGIDEERHSRGDHPTTIQRWLDHQERMYGWSDDGSREFSVVVNGTEYRDSLPSDRSALLDLIREQKRAEALYQSGDAVAARNIWENRDPDVPEWMYFYHGVFS